MSFHQVAAKEGEITGRQDADREGRAVAVWGKKPTVIAPF